MFIKGKNFISSYRIDLGLELGCEKEDDAFVVLREPNTMELLDIQGAGGDLGIARKLVEMLPALLIDHDFYESENVRATNEQVAKTIGDKAAATFKIIREYTGKISAPFQTKTGSK